MNKKDKEQPPLADEGPSDTTSISPDILLGDLPSERWPPDIRSPGGRLSDLAVEHPNDDAIIFATSNADRAVTWRELDDFALRLGHVLVDRGVRRGRMVAALVPNSIELVALAFATWRAGGCFVPINPETPPPERDLLLGLADPVLTVAAAADGLSKPAVELARLLKDASHASTTPLPDIIAHPAKAIGSGGSTGSSKLIVSSTPWLWHPVYLEHPVLRGLGLRPGQRQLVSGPLYHNWPYDLCFLGLMLGGNLVLMDRFDAARAVDLIRQHRVEYAGLVPTTMRRIAQLPNLRSDDLASLEVICHTAAPCPKELKQRWFDLIGAERVLEVYGATEGIGNTVIRGDEWLERPGSVGRPVGSEARILDDAGAALGPGEIGIVYMRPADPSTVGKYQGAPQPVTTNDGFVTVGDLGWMDEDGFVYLVDRRADLIITGGVNVYPAEVEAVLSGHPAVAEAVVVGIPDEEWGRRVHAIVELLPGAASTADDLRSFCRGRIAPQKVPKTVEIVDHIPRSDAGKVRRSQLVHERASNKEQRKA